ncbi:MAG TPA: hypothetical protein VK843_01425 [Planctomycetota bacterium]|nr:hypothetical protein [Planctomycetota bacterium]
MSIHEPSESLPLGEPHIASRGVLVERRCFMASAAAAFAAAGLPGLARAGSVDPRIDALTFDDFLEEVVPLARSLVADTSFAGQSRYLHTLAAHAVRLGDVAQPEMRANGEGKFIGANEGGDPFVVLHWRMEAGAEILPHPHIYGNVVTLALEGEVRVCNYEIVGARDFDTKQGFVIRRTLDQWLTRGSTNLVNLERSYVHGFVAGAAGARGLDITTRVREKRPTPALEIGKLVDAARSEFEARWGVG